MCLFFACSRGKSAPLPKDDEIVARVNGTPITRYDVEYGAQRSLGDLALPSIERRVYPRLLEAAVQSRAMALAAERELGSVEKKALEKEVASYREQLLVRRYLQRHSPAKPVTNEMITEYYQNHRDRFGGGSDRSYEILGTARALASEERDRVLAKLADSAKQSDWKAWAAELEKSGLPITYTTAMERDTLLHGKLRELVSSLRPGAPSAPAFVQGRAYVARVAGENERTPKPLEEVREEVQRLLTPAQYSAAIQRAATLALKDTKVEIVEASTSGASKPRPTASAASPARGSP